MSTTSVTATTPATLMVRSATGTTIVTTPAMRKDAVSCDLKFSTFKFYTSGLFWDKNFL